MYALFFGYTPLVRPYFPPETSLEVQIRRFRRTEPPFLVILPQVSRNLALTHISRIARVTPHWPFRRDVARPGAITGGISDIPAVFAGKITQGSVKTLICLRKLVECPKSLMISTCIGLFGRFFLLVCRWNVGKTTANVTMTYWGGGRFRH